MKILLKPFKTIFNFIKYHPIWSTAFFCLIIYFINEFGKEKPNPLGYFFLFLFILAAISPYIRKLQREKRAKIEADYLAKRIAEETENITKQ